VLKSQAVCGEIVEHEAKTSMTLCLGRNADSTPDLVTTSTHNVYVFSSKAQTDATLALTEMKLHCEKVPMLQDLKQGARVCVTDRGYALGTVIEAKASGRIHQIVDVRMDVADDGKQPATLHCKVECLRLVDSVREADLKNARRKRGRPKTTFDVDASFLVPPSKATAAWRHALRPPTYKSMLKDVEHVLNKPAAAAAATTAPVGSKPSKAASGGGSKPRGRPSSRNSSTSSASSSDLVDEDDALEGDDD